jgi:mannobiose 2-epimerase
MAGRAFDFVMNHFWDAQLGGAFWRLDDTGRVLDDSKKIYGHAFYIYALAEYHRTFGVPVALARAIDLFELIERHAHDPGHGGYLEVRQRNWSEANADARLSDKDMNEKKSMNNHLHLLEAYTNLYRVWKDQRVEQRLRELIALFEQRILDPRTLHLHHFFNEQWQVRSDTYTFGHDIEGTWLLCEAAEVLGDISLLKRVQAVALRMAEVALREGIDVDGALRYEGKMGKIIDAGKECWPQAEAVIGFLNAFQLSGDEKYLNASLRAWDFIENHLVDRVHGEWFWRITPEGRVDPTLPKVNEWKGPYHGSRACLETLHRLRAISAGKEQH